MKLSFDEVRHAYALDGRPVRGVTSVIHDLCGIGWEAEEWHKRRGTVVHEAAALLIAGRLDWQTWEQALRAALTNDQADDILGRVGGVEKFLRESQLIGVRCEVRMGSRRWQYAGTADLFARYGSELNISTGVDWKGTLDPRSELQAGAYSVLFTENNRGRKLDRFAIVELDGATGNYRAHWGSRKPVKDKGMFDLKLAEQDWLTGLAFHGAMARRGITNNQHER